MLKNKEENAPLISAPENGGGSMAFRGKDYSFVSAESV
jgi:hypothetical protein